MSRRSQTDWTAHPWAFMICCTEITARCHDAIIAAGLLESTPFPPSPDDTRRAWFAARAILIASAAISKIAGGKSGWQARQRASLRQALGIGPGSALHSRAVRDYSEHVDDRILKFIASGGDYPLPYVAYNFAPSPLREGGGVMPGLGGIDVPANRVFLNLDLEAKVISFWDAEVSIPELLAEIRRILPLAETAARHPPNVV